MKFFYPDDNFYNIFDSYLIFSSESYVPTYSGFIK